MGDTCSETSLEELPWVIVDLLWVHRIDGFKITKLPSERSLSSFYRPPEDLGSNSQTQERPSSARRSVLKSLWATLPWTLAGTSAAPSSRVWQPVGDFRC